jgi:hypothetical protein
VDLEYCCVSVVFEPFASFAPAAGKF